MRVLCLYWGEKIKFFDPCSVLYLQKKIKFKILRVEENSRRKIWYLNKTV